MVAVNGKKQIKSHGYYTEETISDDPKNDGLKTEEIHIPENVIPEENSVLDKAKVAIASILETIKSKKEQIQRSLEK
jgi:hypothetical protein